MIDRYKRLNDNGVRDIKAYNTLCQTDDELQKMPQIVIVIDELSDLMAVAPPRSRTRLCALPRWQEPQAYTL